MRVVDQRRHAVGNVVGSETTEPFDMRLAALQALTPRRSPTACGDALKFNQCKKLTRTFCPALYYVAALKHWRNLEHGVIGMCTERRIQKDIAM